MLDSSATETTTRDDSGGPAWSPPHPAALPLPDAMREARRWLLWRAEPGAKPGDKPRKTPYYITGARRHGTLDTPEDQAQLASFADACSALARGKWSGLGFALGPDESGRCWQGIDLDHLPEHPELSDVARDLPCYVEKSPSKEGLHAIGYGERFTTLGNNRTGIEAYAAGRYFTVTGDAVGGQGWIGDLSKFVADRLVPLHKPHVEKPEPKERPEPRHSDTEPDDLIRDLRSALWHLDADAYGEWIATGLALKTLGDQGRALWLDWSSTSAKFDAAVAARRWEGFRPESTDYRVIFAEAQRSGWANPKARPHAEPAPEPEPVNGHDILSWADSFEVTEKQMSEIQNPEFAYEDLVISGHMAVIVGPPGSGKTHILTDVAGAMTRKGYRVFYVNADTSGGDAKHWHAHAEQHGYRLLLPDLIVGQSMQDVVKRLRGMADAPGDLSDVVFIFDTLKKMTDVIAKRQAKELYGLFRALSARDMTIVCAAHTNKHKGEDGRAVFEGTGDLRADFDEMIYLDADKRADGATLVSTNPDKVRGTFSPITFVIGRDRIVSRTDYIDVASAKAEAAQREADADVIEHITAALADGPKVQGVIIAALAAEKVYRRTAQRVLDHYARGPGALWVETRAALKNARQYHLPEKH